MTTLTKTLPISLIPKQNLIASMGNLVVHHGRFDKPSSLLALHTQRVCTKVSSSGLLPPAVVATLVGVVSVASVQRFVVLTVLLPIRYQLRAARMLARRAWSVWHMATLLSVCSGCGERIRNSAPAPKESKEKRPYGNTHNASLHFFAV